MLSPDLLKNCRVCPHCCGVNRLTGNSGRCHLDHRPRIHTCQLHFGEEPPISGAGGSGTIFFSYCNLACVYCQNYPFSQDGQGQVITVKQLAQEMLKLQAQGAHNINLVTPTAQVVSITQALQIAKSKGLVIPVCYNTSSYERKEIVKELSGLVDIYLADLRYGDDLNGEKYSTAKNYFTVAKTAIKEMFKQVGLLKVDQQGLAQKGLIVRHLVLPNGISGSEQVLKFLAEEISPEVSVSLMSQYFPFYRAAEIQQLSRRITQSEYQTGQDLMQKYGLHNGWIQPDYGLLELAGVNLAQGKQKKSTEKSSLKI